MKVLVADDDLTSRNILQALLKQWNMDPIPAKDGLEAWDVLQKPDSPKLVLLDWQMPGLDGIDVLRKLKAVDSSGLSYVIFLTSRQEKADLVSALDAGADDYLSKPFDANELRARIDVGRRFLELRMELMERMNDLQEALDHVKTLQGILPVCMHCHKIRNDAESWEAIETYLESHSSAQISHGLCPECLEKYYPKE